MSIAARDAVLQYLAINPSGKIPTLIDGEFVLAESNAILLYLAEAHGGNRLWSSEAKQRGQNRPMAFLGVGALATDLDRLLVGGGRPPPAAGKNSQAAACSGLEQCRRSAGIKYLGDGAQRQCVPGWICRQRSRISRSPE